MLDTLFHQGASLHSTTPQTKLRVIAVASHEHASDGLETLWQICAHLQRMGYPVVVLDGTARECDDSPGLMHLLTQHTWAPDEPTGNGSGSALAVLPAGLGLGYLARENQDTQTSALQALYAHFRAYAVVVVYAPAETLGGLLMQTDTVPLVMLRPSPEGVLSAYTSLKHIALSAGLTCTVATMVHGSTKIKRQKAEDALQALHECASRHLGNGARGTMVQTNNPQDLQRLALHLLENAGTISEVPSSLGLSTAQRLSNAYLVRSH